MTHKVPFQPLPFCDSAILSFLPMHTDYGVSKELLVFRTLLQHIVKKQ